MKGPSKARATFSTSIIYFGDSTVNAILQNKNYESEILMSKNIVRKRYPLMIDEAAAIFDSALGL